ncbi:MAG: hypothetical protein HC767_13845 [Akkermansiaceae bacterium]|nr:hypothetical protein [Akkermansiaceae bacterium]
MQTSTDIRPVNWINATRSDHKFAYTTINAPVPYGDYADMTVTRQRAGEPDVNLHYSYIYGVQVELPLIVNSSYYYTFRLHSIPTNRSINFRIANVAPGDFVKAQFTSFGNFPGSRVNSATSVSSMAALDNATTNAYFKDSSGSIWVKVFQNAGLHAHQSNGCTIVWNSNGTLPVVDTDGDGMGDLNEGNSLRDPLDVGDFGADFNIAGNAEGWTASNAATQTLNGSDFLVSANATGTPFLIRNGLALKGSDVRSLAIRYRSEGSRTLRLYWANQDGPYAESRAINATTSYVANSGYKIAIFNLTGNTDWVGKTINSLRFDLMGGTNTQTWVDWIRGSDTVDLDGDGMLTRAELDLGRDPTSAVDFGFEFNGISQEDWTSTNTASTSLTGTDLLVRAASASSPLISRAGLSMKGSEVGNITCRMQSEGGRTVRFYWGNENGGLSESRAINATTTYVANSGYKEMTFNLASHPEWAGRTITELRIDLMGGTNNRSWLDWVRGGDGTISFTGAGPCILDPDTVDLASKAVFDVAPRAGGGSATSMTFDVQAGVRYRMMASPDLAPDSWHQINEFTADRDERVLMPYNSDLPAEFYRIELTAPGGQ